MSIKKRLQALCVIQALCVLLCVLMGCGSPPERHLSDFELERVRLDGLRPVVLDSGDSFALLVYRRGIGDSVLLRLEEGAGERVPDNLFIEGRTQKRIFQKGKFSLEFTVPKHLEFPNRAVEQLAGYF
jgi:hypothetical protein